MKMVCDPRLKPLRNKVVFGQAVIRLQFLKGIGFEQPTPHGVAFGGLTKGPICCREVDYKQIPGFIQGGGESVTVK